MMRVCAAVSISHGTLPFATTCACEPNMSATSINDVRSATEGHEVATK